MVIQRGWVFLRSEVLLYASHTKQEDCAPFRFRAKRKPFDSSEDLKMKAKARLSDVPYSLDSGRPQRENIH